MGKKQKVPSLLCSEPSLRLRLKVEFINSSGLVEAGVDGGGLAREFLSELLLASFDPNRGFFVYAEDKTLYPNPEADFLAPNFRQHYFFMGRMLAKVSAKREMQISTSEFVLFEDFAGFVVVLLKAYQ